MQWRIACVAFYSRANLCVLWHLMIERFIFGLWEANDITKSETHRNTFMKLACESVRLDIAISDEDDGFNLINWTSGLRPCFSWISIVLLVP